MSDFSSSFTTEAQKLLVAKFWPLKLTKPQPIGFWVPSGFLTLYKDNQFLSHNEKSFLFVLTDATYFHDDPRAWKEEDMIACENVTEPDNFEYPYELAEPTVCKIFEGLAESFRNSF